VDKATPIEIEKIILTKLIEQIAASSSPDNKEKAIKNKYLYSTNTHYYYYNT